MNEDKYAPRAPVSPEPAPESELKPIDQADTSREVGLRDYPEETLCPSCGRFVGAYEKCPYCGAELKKRMSLILWKRIAVFGTLLGLAVMWYAASRMEPAEVQIGEIGETFNNAIVTVEGVVVSRKLYADRGMIMLRIADGSGTIGAMSYKGLPEFQKLGNLPRVGDKVRTVGQIQIDAKYGKSLGLNLPHRLAILEAEEAQSTAVSQLRESLVNRRVAVEGAVKYPPRYGKVTITDGAADIVVALDEDNLGEGIPDLKVGEGVRVTGVLVVDKNDLMIVPGDAADIVAVEGVSVEIPRLAIKGVTLDQLNDVVEIEGTTAGFRAFKNGGGALTVSDGTGTISVPLFAGIFDQIKDNGLLKSSGTKVRIRGKVGEYRNQPQIQPLSAEGITILR
ncbi:MAG TPA: hypothetical protein PK636_02290 [bacterium]|nr:hypothetical protein [bacterium]HPJ71496.1 hypothetical protein [bacterium]HPQ67202.1 hypothetical protein [bacterium]